MNRNNNQIDIDTVVLENKITETIVLLKSLEEELHNNEQTDSGKVRISALSLTNEQLVEKVAFWEDTAVLFENAYEYTNTLAKFYENVLSLIIHKVKTLSDIDELKSTLSSITSDAMLLGASSERQEKARAAANAKHDMPGGSREKKEAIRQIWASGKYSSKDLCAEMECGPLGISFSTARKALRNQPIPKPN